MRKGPSILKTILAPTDGSQTARKAAIYAYDLAALSGGTVTLVSVVDRSVFVGRPSVPPEATPTRIVQPLEDYLRESAEVDMREIEAQGEARGVTTRMAIRYGHPVEEILAEARRSRADLIVMGSHGKSALSAALLGSVTFGVIHRATRTPVLIIRR
jgi:nucleotide-binding universal stress UspA family protein